MSTVYTNDMHHWKWTNEDTDVDKLLGILGRIDMRIRECDRLRAAGDQRWKMIDWYSRNEHRWLMHRIHELDPTIGSLEAPS